MWPGAEINRKKAPGTQSGRLSRDSLQQAHYAVFGYLAAQDVELIGDYLVEHPHAQQLHGGLVVGEDVVPALDGSPGRRPRAA